MIHFSCNLIGNGWIEATLSSDDNETTIIASHLSDAPYQLIIALALLSEGGRSETVCMWQDEPGEYRWIFKNQNDSLEIKILQLKQTFSKESNENARVVFYGEEALGKFVRRVLREFNKIKLEYTVDGYRNLWGYEFPIQAINRLSVAIKR